MLNLCQLHFKLFIQNSCVEKLNFGAAMNCSDKRIYKISFEQYALKNVLIANKLNILNVKFTL